MGLHCYGRGVLLIAWCIWGLNARLVHADEGVEWLRGSGKDLEIRLAGEVLDADGRPAREVTLTAGLNHQVSPVQLEPKVEGNRFEVWVPANRTQWYSMWLAAQSNHGDAAGYESLNAFQLRQAAIDGLKLTLRRPARQVDVKVLHHGEPVADVHVQGDVGFSINLRARTDANGVARLGIPPGRELSSLMAWTDDHRIGGYGFSRKPTRDPAAASHTIELCDCIDRTIRFVDEEGLPVSGVDFMLHLATPPPDYNYLGQNEHSRMTTDEHGEAVYRWFPDWEEHHLYADIDSNRYFVDGDPDIRDDAVVIKLKRSKSRKEVAGRIEFAEDAANAGLGGFYVMIESFQAEQEHRIDMLPAFTDADGTFAHEVLPDATYVAYALDARWVSDMIDFIPFQSRIERANPARLVIHTGQPVEVVVTTGPEKRPYPDLHVSFQRDHSYQWIENGEVRGGSNGAQWWAVTDEDGIARTFALPGKLDVSVYTPLWRTEKEVEVVGAKPTAVSLHREIEDSRTITGRLVFADGVEGTLEGATVALGAVDGDYNFEQKPTVDASGSFQVKTVARHLGAFARTADGAAAGFVVSKELDKPLEITLRPTLSFHGMVVDGDDRPVANHKLSATVRVEGTERHDGLFLTSFDALRLTTTTDELGTFSFEGLPTNVRVLFSAEPLAGSSDSHYLGDAYLEPCDARPPEVFRIELEKKPAPAAPLAERYEMALRDARLGGYHVMAVLSAPGDDVAEFVDNNFVDYRKNKEVSAFMQLLVQPKQASDEETELAFLDERGWQLPGEGRVLAIALDASGEELARMEIAVADGAAAEQAADFVRKHAPAKVDAKQKWDEAFAEARSSNRRVWARVSGRYCGPCFRLARWMDGHQELLAKDYVMLKVDGVADENGGDVARRLTRGGQHGIPFHVIFDADEAVLIDSAGPLGNIGHPSGVEGKRHLRKMLMETRQRATDEEIERLLESLED
jgi:hypothetical protein